MLQIKQCTARMHENLLVSGVQLELVCGTDAGKRDLPAPLRNRFTEIWVAEPSERSDLLMLAAAYLADAAPQPPLDAVVDFYCAAKAEAVCCALLIAMLAHSLKQGR